MMATISFMTALGRVGSQPGYLDRLAGEQFLEQRFEPAGHRGRVAAAEAERVAADRRHVRVDGLEIRAHRPVGRLAERGPGLQQVFAPDPLDGELVAAVAL